MDEAIATSIALLTTLAAFAIVLGQASIASQALGSFGSPKPSYSYIGFDGSYVYIMYLGGASRPISLVEVFENGSWVMSPALEPSSLARIPSSNGTATLVLNVGPMVIKP